MSIIRSIHLYAVEKVSLVYMLITTIIICLQFNEISNSTILLANRLLFAFLIVVLSGLTSLKNIWPIRFARYAFLGALFSYWYTETFDINMSIGNYDYLLAKLEHLIFGFQPALSFSQSFPQHWISEIFNFAYFSFYPLIIGTSLFFFFTNRKYFEYFFFSILFSFLSFYLIFILFPTTGPQYYFPAVGIENVNNAEFHDVGNYFRSNQLLVETGNNSGVFFQLVENSQKVGERPTGAFPSSHVGITVLIMILIYKNRRKLLFYSLLPLAAALIGATVYIQAHYVVDVFAGFISAFVFYLLSRKVYKRITSANNGILELTPHFLHRKRKDMLKQ